MAKNSTQWTDDGYGESNSITPKYLVDENGNFLTDGNGNRLTSGSGDYTEKASSVWEASTPTSLYWNTFIDSRDIVTRTSTVGVRTTDDNEDRLAVIGSIPKQITEWDDD